MILKFIKQNKDLLYTCFIYAVILVKPLNIKNNQMLDKKSNFSTGNSLTIAKEV